MKYDPIMCMMVDDSVKTEDEVFIIEANKQGHPYKAIVNGEEKELIKYYTHKGFTDIKLTKTASKDSKTIGKAIRSCNSRVSTRNVVTSNIAFEEIKKMTGIVPETVKQKGDTMEFYHSGVKVAEWDMNNAEVKVFV